MDLSITGAASLAINFSFYLRPNYYSQFRRRHIPLTLIKNQRQEHSNPRSIPFSKSQERHSSFIRRRRRNALREKLLSLPRQDQDPHENVLGVSVNEEEMVKRSLVPAWSSALLADEEEENVSSKIGKSVLVESYNPSLIDTLKSVSIRHVPFLWVFPRAGIIVFCAFCILGATAKLFASNGRVELKREEVDMLRRKKKLRMEKEKLDKGNVKVLQNVQGLSVASNVRPQLDRNELMKCIQHAAESGSSLFLSDSSCHHRARDHEFHSKVSEIREMAREVRELEQQGRVQNDKRGREKELSSAVHVSNSQIVANDCVKPKPMKIGLDQGSFSEIDCHVDHGKDIQLYVDIEKNEVPRENSKETMNVVSDGEASNISVVNTDIVTRNVDHHETALKQIPTSVENIAHGSKSNSITDLHSPRNEEVKQKGTGSINLVDKESCCNMSGTSTSVRNIPKIMKSVKKAKEYLFEKHGISAESDKHQSSQEMRLNCSAVGESACSNDGKADVRITQTINENNKAVDPSKLSTSEIYGDESSVSLLKRSFANEVSETNFHEVATRNAMFSKRIDGKKVLGLNNLDLPHDLTGISGKPSSDALARTSILDDLTTDKMVYTSQSLLGSVNAENTCFKTSKTKNLCVEGSSVENQSGRDNDAHTYYSSDNTQGLESHETSYENSSSVAYSVRDRQGRIDSARHNSKELNIYPHNRYFGSKEQVKTFEDGFGVFNVTTNGHKSSEEDCKEMVEGKKFDSPDPKSGVESPLDKIEFDGRASQSYPVKDDTSLDVKSLIFETAQESGDKHDMKGLPTSEKSFQLDSAGPNHDTETLEVNGHGSWLEDNFQKFDPIIKMIGTGFRENYMVAKEKVQQSAVTAEISELGLLGEDEELEWMNDEKLREIVFQVRDNELAGRDPFHLMDAADQHAFFKGLELKAEKLNRKLLSLHEWVHSRIENLDYGADGISLDDPLENIVPRWKGPPIDKELGFLDKFTEHRMMSFAGRQSHVVKGQTRNSLQKSEKLPYSTDVSPYSSVNDQTPNGASASASTLIEGSDGSRRPGKKMGKEHWQHTKKWSRGFLEVYNAETDPEIKSIMKDMGKGLDKWITEKETQEVADLITRIPKRKQRYIQKKMERLKREVGTYGAQAVITKYREYSDEKEEDYLWWLDLQFVLCIELYTVDDGVQRVGFYSLEMAKDLELHPVQYHVIAFEDLGDSKNFCYIVQAHMDVLGSGRSFVVARPPKDAFREAKANGFNVTVIKKGELKFNVDQTLEEVEEQITEIGSKMYHDKIMKERAVDIRSLMKGLVRADKASRR